MASKNKKEQDDSQPTGRRKLVEARMKILGIGREHLKLGDEFTPASFIPTGQMEIDVILGEGNAFLEER